MERATAEDVGTDATPEWVGVDGAELRCPLCEYSLRGLAEPRCPECGFAFTWAELRAAGRDRHPWLFEHGGRRSLASFAVTVWHNRRPWRFWRAVTPANPPNVRRLVVYWAVAGLVATAMILGPLPHGMWQAWDRSNFFILAGRSSYRFARPSTADWFGQLCTLTWNAVRSPALFTPRVIGPPLLVLAWPWMTAAALLVFRRSLRQAKIGPGHVLRVAVYGCDLGPAVWVAVVVAMPVGDYISWRRFSRNDGEPLAYLALAVGVWATVRLAAAGRLYLRAHLPLATAAASQVVVVLFVWTCLALTTGMGNLFR